MALRRSAFLPAVHNGAEAACLQHLHQILGDAAHIDREANGMIGILGTVPSDYNFKCVEFKSKDNEAKLADVFLAMAGFKESMYFIGALDLKNFIGQLPLSSFFQKYLTFSVPDSGRRIQDPPRAPSRAKFRYIRFPSDVWQPVPERPSARR